MGGNRYIVAGVTGGVAAVLVYIFGQNILIMLAAGIVVFLLTAFFLRPAPLKTVLETNEKTIEDVLASGEKYLRQIHQDCSEIRDEQVREKTDIVCQLVRRIMTTLRERPENVASVQTFFSYYLPTISTVLSKYETIERGGGGEDHREIVLEYLETIGAVLKKMQANLLKDELMDLSVEMEVLTNMARMDGLLSDEGMSVSLSDQNTVRQERNGLDL